MADYLRRLNQPDLVVKFQRWCGVYPRDKTKDETNANDSCEENGNHPNYEGDWQERLSHSSPPCDNGIDSPNAKPTNGIDSPDAKPTSHSNLKKRTVVTKTPTSSIETEVTSGSGNSEDEDNEKDFIITNKFLNIIFEFGASLGNELFYITFFPWWFWNVDGYVGRRVCVFWCLYMYLGQAAKDIIKWPRPASPPVIRMENRYAKEYGMPSTHSMVGAGIPFSLLILTCERYEYPFVIGLLIACVWCSLVCLSRLYLGMHTVLDILAGLLFVFVLMVLCFPFLDTIDDFILHHPYSPIVSILVPLAMCLCYPTLDKWSTARGDTTLILACGAGISVGHWVSFQYGFMQKATTSPPYQIIYPTWMWFGQMLLRLSFGVVVLVATRTVMKLLSFNMACYIFGMSKDDFRSHQKLRVELPYKFVTYSLIAFNSVYVCPQVFRYLGIERETYFTEI